MWWWFGYRQKILVGPNSFAGEWGHVPIGNPKKTITLRSLFSGKGLERQYLSKFKKNLLQKIYLKNLEKIHQMKK